MILLITSSARGQECAHAVEVAANEPAQLAKTLGEAVNCLRSSEYNTVVLDECLLDSDPDQADLIMQHLGTAMPVHVNCATSGSERVVREVRAAMRRRRREEQIAREAVEQNLRSELREPLTAILLECDLVLSIPNLPNKAEEKVRAIDELARRLSARLELTEQSSAVHR